MKEAILAKNRECKDCPPHFVRIKINKPRAAAGTFAAFATEDNGQKIRDWCFDNIPHRFFVGMYTDVDPAYSVIIDYEVAAFEDGADATYFSLMLPTFK